MISDVIYLAGGKGVRAGLGYPKQFSRLNGKPILIYGLETLRKITIAKIIIPTCQDISKLLDDYNIKNCEMIDAGETRQQSVYNALKLVKSEYVLIMEAVRPFCSKELIEKIIKVSGDFVVPRSIMYSTVIHDCGGIINRDFCGEVQMPQKFKTKLLMEAHEKAKEDHLINFTDDAALIMECSDIKPKVLKGEQCNIKITTPLDLKIAEGIYEYNNNRE